MVAAVALDTGGLMRLEAVQADPNTPSVVFQRLTDVEKPDTLRDVAKSWGLPVGRFIEWFTTAHANTYDAALKVLADALAHEAIAIADEQAEVVKENGDSYDPDVPRDKLRVDTRLKVAAKWDRKRYGEDVDRITATPVTIQIANLRGAPLQITTNPPAVALPAPAEPEKETI